MLDVQTLLQAWEIGSRQDALERSITLLTYAFPGHSRDKITDLTIGQRDVSLMYLRQCLFGDALTALATCPACGERIEINTTVGQFMLIPFPSLTEGAIAFSFSIENCKLTFRLPTIRDLLGLRTSSNPRTELEMMCIVNALIDGSVVCARDVPQSVRDALVEYMAQCDPQAEVWFELSCPECAHEWVSIFDVVAFLWREIEVAAQRLLYEVHTLAWAYGWRETEILAMSAVRRQRYIEMVSHV